MERKFTLILLLGLMLSAGFSAQSQEREFPEWRKLKYLSEEEMYKTVNNRNFEETAPPTGEVRFPGEYEPMQAVMIVYPLGIPMELVKEMAEDCKVITVAQSYDVESAKNEFQYYGVNMDNCEFLAAKTDSYWIRDFGPWYIFEGKNAAIVDSKYNRPRPNDDMLPSHFAKYWDIPMYGMNVVHTGGNMMQDGFGVGVSDDIVIKESEAQEITEEQVYERMKDYLGIDPYHVTIDPQGQYIAHVDCWGKFLAPDKILLARVPENHAQYDKYEEVADYFKSTNCSWGYPYKVYRVDLPGGNAICPYTNSLILNKKVLVPMGSKQDYNEAALQVYRDAMPGYEIVGIADVAYNDWSWDGWLNTDALHCRTRGVMDFDMLYVDHRDVLFGEEKWHDSMAVVSKFIAYSGAELKQDSLLVYYSIDGGEYQTAAMTATGNEDEYVAYIKGYQIGSEVKYYVFGADESGRRCQQPVFGELDPHSFVVTEYFEDFLSLNPAEIVFFEKDSTEMTKTITVTNNTRGDAVIENLVIEDEENYSLEYEFSLPYTIALGESVEMTVSLTATSKAEKYNTNIVITSTVGEQKIPVKYEYEEPEEPIDPVDPVELAAPANLIATPDVKACSISLTWDAVENALSYNVYRDNELLVNTTVTNYTDNDVERLTEYCYTVTAVRDELESEKSEEHCASVAEDGIIENNAAAVRIFPNPMNDVLYVEGDNLAKVTVFNAVGQQVLSVENVNEIDVTSLSSGLYFVKVADDKGNISLKKVVK